MVSVGLYMHLRHKVSLISGWTEIQNAKADQLSKQIQATFDTNSSLQLMIWA